METLTICLCQCASYGHVGRQKNVSVGDSCDLSIIQANMQKPRVDLIFCSASEKMKSIWIDAKIALLAYEKLAIILIDAHCQLFLKPGDIPLSGSGCTAI